MAVEYRKTCRFWYARFKVNGKRICFPLDVEVKGAPGSQEFIDSMVAAKEAEGRYKAMPMRGDAAYHQKVADALAGQAGRPTRVNSVPLTKLADMWMGLPRAKPTSRLWELAFRGAMRRFCEFMEKHGATTMADVTPKLAMDFIEKRRAKISGATFNSQLGFLRSMFTIFAKAGGVEENPFATAKRAPRATVNRIPFTREELDRLLQECGEDIAGAVATAACSGMRRHDACTLEWKFADLQGGYLRQVLVSKNGARVDVPILPLLRRHLDAALKKGVYVWPAAADMALHHPNNLNYRMARALEAARISRTEERKGPGCRRANVRGWHGLKTTFVTMALNGGMPIEMLRKIVGNSTLEIVRRNYYQPEKEKMAEELSKALGQFGK